MSALRPDLAIIATHVDPGSRVLDIGCGDGTLLAALRDARRCDARGMEIEPHNVAACVARGLSVIQGDADEDLAFYPDASFDYAILSETLQTMVRPDRVLEELLRIGKRAFVSFPNFAHWRGRGSFLLGGGVAGKRALAVGGDGKAHNPPPTLADFSAFVAERGITVERSWFLSGDREITTGMANLRAEHAIFLISR